MHSTGLSQASHRVEKGWTGSLIDRSRLYHTMDEDVDVWMWMWIGVLHCGIPRILRVFVQSNGKCLRLIVTAREVCMCCRPANNSQQPTIAGKANEVMFFVLFAPGFVFSGCYVFSGLPGPGTRR